VQAPAGPAIDLTGADPVSAAAGEPAPEHQDDRPADAAPQLQEATPAAAVEPVAESTDPQADDLAEELRLAEEGAEEHVTAILTAALDSLGAAHHRPFSRA
jgi:hypothetical protein